MSSNLHVFEAANLGTAPFALDHVTGEGGNCEYCGTSIVWRFYIKGLDGKVFFVGSDCVMKTGDAGLMRRVDAEVKRRQNEARKERDSAKIASLTAMLCDESVKVKLNGLPHPTAYLAKKGNTFLSYASWIMKNAGNSGKLELYRKIQKL
jgi:hypothetical protein